MGAPQHTFAIIVILDFRAEILCWEDGGCDVNDLGDADNHIGVDADGGNDDNNDDQK